MSTLIGLRARAQTWPTGLLQESPGAWTVIRTYPRREAKMADWLQHHGFAGCAFWEERLRRYPKKAPVRSQVPLLPGYVFAVAPRAEHDQLYASAHALHCQEAPPKELSEDLRRLATLCDRHEGSVHFRPELQPGSEITVTAGSLEGFRGVIVHRRGTCELVVNLPVLGTAVAVTLDADTVALCA